MATKHHEVQTAEEERESSRGRSLWIERRMSNGRSAAAAATDADGGGICFGLFIVLVVVEEKQRYWPEAAGYFEGNSIYTRFIYSLLIFFFFTHLSISSYHNLFHTFSITCQNVFLFIKFCFSFDYFLIFRCCSSLLNLKEVCFY